MKNFLIALVIMLLFCFIKNIYDDTNFLSEEVDMLNYEILQKELIIKNLKEENFILVDNLKKEKKKIKQPKKNKKKINKPVEISPEPLLNNNPQTIDTLKIN
jgi:hypothetical protein